MRLLEKTDHNARKITQDVSKNGTVTVEEGSNFIDFEIRLPNTKWEQIQKIVAPQLIIPSFGTADIQNVKEALKPFQSYYGKIGDENLDLSDKTIKNPPKELKDLVEKIDKVLTENEFKEIIGKHKDIYDKFSVQLALFKVTDASGVITYDIEVEKLRLFFSNIYEEFDNLIPEERIAKEDFEKIFEKNKQYKPFFDLIKAASIKLDFETLYTKSLYYQKLIKSGKAPYYTEEYKEALQLGRSYLQTYVPALIANGQVLFDQIELQLLSQLWLTKDKKWFEVPLENARKLETGKSESSTDAADPNKELKRLERQQIMIDSQLIYLVKLTIPQKWEKCCDTLPDFTRYQKNQLDLLKEKEANAVLIEDLKEKIANAAKDSQNQTVIENSTTYEDQLLYTGKLMTGYMHHYDASNNYFNMNRKPVAAVNEEEYLAVLIHNEKTGKSFSIEVTFDSIAAKDDLSILAESVNFVVPGANESLLVPEPTLETITEFLTNYEIVKFFKNVIQMDFYKDELSSKKSESPIYTSYLVNYEFPTYAPAKVTYKISEGKGDKRDSIKTSGFRINKLYRLGYKVGMCYSFFTSKSYEIVGNAANLSSSTYGLDAVAGLQVYFKKNDKRKPISFRKGSKGKADPFCSSLYGFAGIPISSNPLKNFFIGGGWEPIDGMAITAGVQIGSNQKLENINGTLAVKDNWRIGGPFICLGFDLSIFKALFTTPSSITNPFKKAS